MGNLKVKPTISPNRRDTNTPIFFGKTLLVSTRSLKILLLPFNNKKLKMHFINDIFQKDLIYIVSAGLCNLIPFDPACLWRVFCLSARSCNKTAKFRNTNKINFFKVTNLKNVWTRDINTRHFWPKCLEKKFSFSLCEKRIGKNIKTTTDRQTEEPRVVGEIPTTSI